MKALRSTAGLAPGCSKGDVRDAIAELRGVLIEIETLLKTGAPRDPAVYRGVRLEVRRATEDARCAVQAMTLRGAPE